MIVLMAAWALGDVSSDDAVGRWKTQTDNGIVEIMKCGASICGRLTTSDQLRANPDLLDGRNKDPSQRTRRLSGVSILSGFTQSKNGWTGGTIYNGQDGGTYKATATVIDSNHLKIKGCIVWPLCKTQIWTRVD